jgi:hypothetical protein
MRVAWVGVGLSLFPVLIAAQEEIARQANQYYQDGNYGSAIEAYEAVLEAGFESGDLYYNLGNAYFKSGDLGRSILNWERAAVRSPRDADIIANLDLANSLTADAVEPLPRFWLFSVLSWWVGLLPRRALIAAVAVAWLALTGGGMLRILAKSEWAGRLGYWSTVGGGVVALVLGVNLLVTELGVGQSERGVILVESVAVRSAPSRDDDLTLFEVHEGTRVRLDQRTGAWAEVVLDDGKVGWVPLDVMGVI